MLLDAHSSNTRPRLLEDKEESHVLMSFKRPIIPFHTLKKQASQAEETIHAEAQMCGSLALRMVVKNNLKIQCQ